MATIYSDEEVLYHEESRIKGSHDVVKLQVEFIPKDRNWEVVVYNTIGQRLSDNIIISGPRKYEEICRGIVRTVGHSDWSAYLMSAA